MPRYDYKCLKCEECFVIRHSINDTRDTCECGKEGALQKVPSIPIYVSTTSAGNVVKQHIEDAKRDIKEFQEDMKKEYNK